MRLVLLWVTIFWTTLIGGFFKHWLWYITAFVFFGPLVGLVIWVKIEKLLRLRKLLRR